MLFLVSVGGRDSLIYLTKTSEKIQLVGIDISFSEKTTKDKSLAVYLTINWSFLNPHTLNPLMGTV